MLKIHTNSYKYNNTDIMASMVLTYYCLKFTDMPLFTMYEFTCLQTSKIDVLDPEGSSPCATC